MKWPLVKSKFYINKLFSRQLSHLLIDSIWKEPDLTVPGIWPLCYSWIGYLQANGPPWVLLSFYVDHDFSCQQSEAANNSNLKSYWLLPDTVNRFTSYFFESRNLQFTAYFCLFAHLIMGRWLSRACREAVLNTLDRQMNMMYLYTVFTLILSVIIPHTKHANSLAIAATATFLALPCLINL